MADKVYVTIAVRSTLSATSIREGETKLGQGIQLLAITEQSELREGLRECRARGAKYALIGVPEDVGPRANLGRSGADKAWDAFLQYFLNMQANRFVDPKSILLVGQVDLRDIHSKEAQRVASGRKISTNDLRELCEEIDDRVYPIIRAIASAGLEPIVIGGGNNNSYPTIKGLVAALRDQDNNPDIRMATVNCDPHADFRAIEGRHSGNPFTYADRDELLRAYCVIGAHENYNSEEMLGRMEARSYPLFYWEDVVRGADSWEGQVRKVIDYLNNAALPGVFGVELDLDGIKNLPSSARTPFGISEEQACYFIHKIASSLDTRYLHLSEGAPTLAEDGARTVGKVLAKATVEYIRARQIFTRGQG